MAQDSATIRTVIGVMTGTSIDGIDTSLVRIHGRGLHLKAELLFHSAQSFGNIGTQLRAAAEQTPLSAGDFAILTRTFGELHVEVIAESIERGRAQPDLISVHGQTIYHRPPTSWQLINPAPIAQRFNCPVVFDLRQADLAAGGQGAPITPLADWILFRHAHQRRAIVNLGGFCNVTILPRNDGGKSDDAHLDDIRGFDVCACNQILDHIARQSLGKPFDENGEAARRGRSDAHLADALLQLLQHQRKADRSLGTGDELLQRVDDMVRSNTAPDDAAATAVHAIARCICAAVREHRIDEIIVAGGGARNAALVQSLKHSSSTSVRLSDELGVPIDARESMAFAVLGALCADGVPITLPQVTGCSSPAPISGMWCVPPRASL